MKTSKLLVKDKNRKKESFFLRANDELVYTGFPLIKKTETNGFVYGAITDFLTSDSDEGCTYGDGFIQAPDTSRAGLVWQVSKNQNIETILEPESDRWGVYSVSFHKPIKTLDDLIDNFRTVLPLLIKKYNESKVRY